MLKSLLLLVAAVVGAGGAHAEARSSQSAPPATDRARSVSASRALVLPTADRFDLRAPADRAYAPAPARWKDDGGATAVDYRVARGGAFGSVGYICLSDDPPGAPREVGVIAGSQDGRLLGASLSYPLR